jgi:hypothetical protein
MKVSVKGHGQITFFSAYLPSGTALGEITASATAFMLRRRSMAAR